MRARLAYLCLWTAAAQLAVGCASPWPSRVTAQVQHQFAAGGGEPVRSVDVLPIDVQLWVDPNRYDAEGASAQFEQNALAAVDASFIRRGYDVRAHLGWDGDYIDARGAPRAGMDPEAMAATLYSLSGYGEAVAAHGGGELLIPYLPERLGEATGADATLYVGGWTYVGKPPERSSRGEKIGKGIVVGLFLVVIIAVAIAAAKKGGGGGLGGGGKAVGAAGKAAVKAVGGAARMVGRASRLLLRTTARVVARTAEAIFRAPDCFGRAGSSTHIHIYGGRPNYFARPHTPKRGRSTLYLELTLVDNRTGLTLWHARQQFPASAVDGDDVARAVEDLVSTLPALSPGGGPPGMRPQAP